MIKPRYIVLVVIVCIWVTAGWYFFVHKAAPEYHTATVTRQDVTEEVLASGNVESSSTAILSFKISGKLATLPIDVGQHVVKGEVLATLDAGQLAASYNAARAALTREEAALDKVLAGSSATAIAVSSASMDSASTALTNKESDLARTITSTKSSLDSVLKSKVDQLFSNVESSPVFGVYITSGTTKYLVTTKDANERGVINNLRRQVSQDIDALGNSIDGGDDVLIESQKASDALDDMRTLLTHIASALNDYAGLDTTAQTIYQGYQTSIAAARTTVETDRQTLLAAMTAYDSARSALDVANTQLAQTTAPSRSEDVAAAQAAVTAAKANVDAAAAALGDARIVSPVTGTVTDTIGTIGSVVGPSTRVVTVIPDAPLDINVNVSEDNIINVKVGQHVRIELDAFPTGTTFSGTVTEVDPAETVIGGAVYYQTKIRFDEPNDRIRSGMTANVWIETGHATGALVIPASALTKDGTKRSVTVVKTDGTVSSTPVTTGLEDANGMVEITSGLEEGVQVILGQ